MAAMSAVKPVLSVTSVSLLILTLCPAISLCSACSHGDIRLVDGNTTINSVSGLVELCVSGTWRRACADLWDSGIEGLAACRHLGCDNSWTDSTYREGMGTENSVYIDICNFFDRNLLECRHSLNYNCTGQREIGVTCTTGAAVTQSRSLNLQTGQVQSRSLLLSWQPTDNISLSDYHVTCDPGGHSYTTSNRTLLIPNLQPYNTYTCCVSTVETEITDCNVIQEESTGCINVTTLEEVPPGPPEDVLVTSVSSTSAVLGWTGPANTNGPLTGYNLSCSLYGDDVTTPSDDVTTPPDAVTIPPAATTHWLGGLSPNTHYSCCLSAANAAGSGQERCVSFITDTVTTIFTTVHATTVSHVQEAMSSIALAAGVTSAGVLMVIATLVVIATVVLVVCAKRQTKKNSDAPKEQQHVYEEMDCADQKKADHNPQTPSGGGDDAVRYHPSSRQLPSTTSLTPQLPQRNYLRDEVFMDELSHTGQSNKGGVELEAENKVYQPLIPPRLYQVKEGGQEAAYQGLTYPTSPPEEKDNHEDYEPVTFIDGVK